MESGISRGRTCRASSRVGARTSIEIPSRGADDFASRSIAGRRKARVLPVVMIQWCQVSRPLECTHQFQSLLGQASPFQQGQATKEQWLDGECAPISKDIHRVWQLQKGTTSEANDNLLKTQKY